MRRGQQLIGLPVMDLKEGEEIGEVVDVIFDPEMKRIEGLEIQSEKLQEVNFIPYQKLYSLGEDIVTVENKEDIITLENKQEGLVDKGQVIGNKVVTNQGQDLGLVEDIVLDDNGGLMGYELTDGLIQDILEGREILALDDNLVYGKDAIIVNRLN